MKKMKHSLSWKGKVTAGTLLLLILSCIVGNQFGITGKNFLWFLPGKQEGYSATSAGARSISFDDINSMASQKLEGNFIYQLKDPGKQLAGFHIPLTEKTALLEYKGEAVAGVKDVDKIQIQVDPSDPKVLYVQSPEVEILDYHTEPCKVWDTKGSIINHYTFDDMPDVAKETKSEFKKVIDQSDLLERAKLSMQSNLESLVYKNKDYRNYEVKVKWVTEETQK